MDTNTNIKKWLWPVIIGALAVAVVLQAVGLNYAVGAERNARYVGMMNVVAEKLSKTVRGVEMNAENVFYEVAKHLDSPQAVIEALGSKTSLTPRHHRLLRGLRAQLLPAGGQVVPALRAPG